MIADLEAAHAVTNRLFATAVEPGLLVEQLHAKRELGIAESIAAWRAWLAENLEQTLALDELTPAHFAWLFPMGGRGSADRESPVIGRRELCAVVAADPVLADALSRSFDRAMGLLGLVDRAGQLEWAGKPMPWAIRTRLDRRVYRMLRSVHNAGLRSRSEALMAFLERELDGDPARAEALSWYRHQVAS